MTDQPTTALQAGDPQRVVGGRYRLLELCGRGGSADVWRAEDEALGRVVAVKIVTVPTDDSAARAGEEARLLARLNHPGLVPVYDAGTEGDTPWVVMELVEGETLSDTIRRGPMSPDRVAVVGRSVADALAYVHAQGLIHRDVKPGNVLVGDDGRVRLTDFGIARLVDAAKVTATGLTVGTASYLAPEQVMGESVGPAADVYALGLVLLECLTGRREYAGNTVEVALARLHRPPEVPDTLPSGWPGLLRAMTDRDPEARPTPSQVAADLDGVIAGGEATTTLARPAAEATAMIDRTAMFQAGAATGATAPRTVDRPLPPARPAARPVAPARSRGGWRWAALLLALVAALAVYGVVQNRTSSTPQDFPTVSTDLPPQLQNDLRRLQELTK